MRNLTADLGLAIFCGAEPRRAEKGVPLPANRRCEPDSVEMPTAPTHFEFNEEEELDRPDPYRELVETQLEMERRAEIEEKRRR